eukprot:m.25921 g.25921  ORF g.25921 m.25921 type:complete len:191 (+) comp4507_c0_seq1:72-644(+)
MAHWLALGFSAWEQPADSTTLCTDEPQELGALRAACAGWSGSFGIATDGRLCGWGRAQLPSIARVQHIACGWDHLVLLRSPASSDCTSELCALSIQQEGCSTLQIITPVATASQSADGQRPRELHCGLSCVLILRGLQRAHCISGQSTAHTLSLCSSLLLLIRLLLQRMAPLCTAAFWQRLCGRWRCPCQ